jgi:FG-GAP-like repeat/Right handed beta helix region
MPGGTWNTDWSWADDLILADFTGDGKTDLYARRKGDNAAVFYRSNGDGSFTQATGWQTQWPYSGVDDLVPMDFDGDAKIDLLAHRRDDDAAVFYRSNGDGSFTQVTGWQTQWPYSGVDDLIPMDFSGDGKADLLAQRSSDNAAVFYRSNGDGSFTQASGWQTQWPYSGADELTMLDFNGDTKTDILARRTSDNAAVFYQSNGDGSFTQVTGWQTQWPYSGADEFLPGDYDGDGKLDLLARRSSDNAAVFYRGDGSGSFEMWTSWTTQWPLGSAANGLTLYPGDYNQDGKTDLFALRHSDKTGVLMLANSNFEFALMTWMIFWPDATANDYRLGDFDGNGRPEFIVRRASDLAHAVLAVYGYDEKVTTTCTATDRASLRACLHDIAAYDEVSIEADIVCNGDDCCGPNGAPLFTIYDASTKQIRGNGHGIVRHDRQLDCFALDMVGDRNITIRDLRFDEDRSVPAPDVPSDNPGLAPTIRVDSSHYVTMHGVSVEHSKGTAILVASSDHFTIRHSRIEHAGLLGVSVGKLIETGEPSRFFMMTETTVTDTGTNGVALGPVEGIANTYDNVISGSTFLRNHRHGMYDLCNHERPCGGGQIHPQMVDHLAIKANIIGDGWCTNCRWHQVFGIEIHSTVAEIVVEDNYLYNNSDCAVYYTDVPDDQHLRFSNNRCENNAGCISSLDSCCPSVDGEYDCSDRRPPAVSPGGCKAPMIWCDCTQSCLNQFFCNKRTQEGQCID